MIVYKVTCVIPTCGREVLLREAVISVLAQGVKCVDEIIVVNNHVDVIADDFFCDIDPSGVVRVINAIPFCGASQARNIGASLASNSILSFLDDDDLWPEGYLEQVFSYWSYDDKICLTRLDKYVDGEILPYKSITPMDLSFNTLFIRNPGVTGSNIFITKELFYSVGGFDVKLKTSEDKDLLIKVLDEENNILILNDVAVFHRSYEGERLTNYDSVLIGMDGFYRKYRKRFNLAMKYSYLKKFSKIKIKKFIQAL